MTNEQKRLRAFFAKKLTEKLTWGDDDTEKLLDFFDPIWPGMTPSEEAKHLTQRTLDFTREFTEWEARQPKPKELPTPMSDMEIDALAAMF